MFDGPVGGVDPSVGSPEAARGRRGFDPDGPPGPVDPSDRPGCLRVTLALLALIGAVVLVLWFAGEVIQTL